jgi:hypothetical protein
MGAAFMSQEILLKDCIRLCWEARHACQETLFRHCLPIGSVHMEENHVKVMTDCITACQVAADFMTRGSAVYQIMCAACADICEACAKSCEYIGDDDLMRCAKACHACARSCRRAVITMRAAA